MSILRREGMNVLSHYFVLPSFCPLFFISCLLPSVSDHSPHSFKSQATPSWPGAGNKPSCPNTKSIERGFFPPFPVQADRQLLENNLENVIAQWICHFCLQLNCILWRLDQNVVQVCVDQDGGSRFGFSEWLWLINTLICFTVLRNKMSVLTFSPFLFSFSYTVYGNKSIVRHQQRVFGSGPRFFTSMWKNQRQRSFRSLHPLQRKLSRLMFCKL